MRHGPGVGSFGPRRIACAVIARRGAHSVPVGAGLLRGPPRADSLRRVLGAGPVGRFQGGCGRLQNGCEGTLRSLGDVLDGGRSQHHPRFALIRSQRPLQGLPKASLLQALAGANCMAGADAGSAVSGTTPSTAVSTCRSRATSGCASHVATMVQERPVQVWCPAAPGLGYQGCSVVCTYPGSIPCNTTPSCAETLRLS